MRDDMTATGKFDNADIMNAMAVNVLMNNYTLEEVAFGELKPGEKLPFDKYVEDLNLYQYQPYLFRSFIEGDFISNSETVAAKSEEEFIRDCFLFQIDFVFAKAPKRKVDFGNDYFLKYKRGFGEFILSLYSLFKQILQTEVDTDFSDLSSVFEARHDERVNYENISKFLVAIKAKGLRQGSCVDRYVKNIAYIPYYVKRILKKNKNRYLLANSDTESIDYKLAILSAIHFIKFEHTKLFELKTQKWEMLNK